MKAKLSPRRFCNICPFDFNIAFHITLGARISLSPSYLPFSPWPGVTAQWERAFILKA